ncbi:hypothetical protein VCX83_16235 [Aeromonas caviae]|uniref:hypothetical protein n=1 Tax=Aeromonas TaxID=642 RepID=UPI0022E74BCA|nr:MULTISPECIES: hypothetical protein [Aeromonas]MEA9423417.1 hypothetical protein [Aeromonas caviae]
MLSITRITNHVRHLQSWILNHFSTRQWLVTRSQIDEVQLPGLRSRVIVCRSLSLYYHLDFSKVPTAKRGKALNQRVELITPFQETGFYAIWKGASAMVWLWDKSALLARLPEAATIPCIPDSILVPEEDSTERMIENLEGAESQSWENGVLIGSKWVPLGGGGIALDRLAPTPLQPREKQWLIDVGMLLVTMALMLSMLLQSGAIMDLWRKGQMLETRLAEQEEGGLLQQHARQRAYQAKAQYVARERLSSTSQHDLINAVLTTLPAHTGRVERYDYQGGLLRLRLVDKKPEPREYVQRIDKLRAGGFILSGTQVQINGDGNTITLTANVRPSVDRMKE